MVDYWRCFRPILPITSITTAEISEIINDFLQDHAFFFSPELLLMMCVFISRLQPKWPIHEQYQFILYFERNTIS